MNVFISWSGQTSKAVAETLRDWLKQVIQAVDPWMSPDIEKGARWSEKLADKLKDARTGIICLTPDNLQEPWILFEAGALSRTVDSPYVCPYLFRVEPADLAGPLAQFQATRAEKEDTRKLVRTVNGALEGKLSETQLNVAFEKWWPDLEAHLARVPQPEVQQSPRRSDREILEEVLGLLRQQARAEMFSRTMSTILGAEGVANPVNAFALGQGTTVAYAVPTAGETPVTFALPTMGHSGRYLVNPATPKNPAPGTPEAAPDRPRKRHVIPGRRRPMAPGKKT